MNAFAAVYSSVMLLRLVVTAALPPHSVIDRGLIPILAHWDLAGIHRARGADTNIVNRRAGRLIKNECRFCAEIPWVKSG